MPTAKPKTTPKTKPKPTPKAPTRGLFITFEGTEGVGKSTLIREVQNQLIAYGLKQNQILLTREPGGNPEAEAIRKIILENEVTPWTELFLYEAARCEHLERKVFPALKQNQLVLCDRFTDSTLAYQAFARGLSWKTVTTLNHIATQGKKPDLTILLDFDPRLGLKRATDRNRFEEEGVKFQQRVRKGFHKARKQDPKRWLTLSDEKATPQMLARAVCEALIKKFPKQMKPKGLPSRAPRH